LARWKNYFSLLLNVCGVNEVRHTEIHTAEPLIPELSAFEVELAIEKLKSHKLTGIDQIPAKLVKAGVEQLATRSLNLLFVFGVRGNCNFIIVSIRTLRHVTVHSLEHCHSIL